MKRARSPARRGSNAESAAGGWAIVQHISERVLGAVNVLFGRGLEAAGGGPRWPARAMTRNPAAQMRAGAEPVAARAAFFALNNANGSNIIETIASGIVGEAGPRPQPQHPAQVVNRELRRRFARWAASAGINGEHLADILRLAINSMGVSGDGFVALQIDEDDRLRLTVLDVEQVDRAKTVELEAGARIIEGVELDALGRVAGFWVFPDRPSAPFMHAYQSERIPASEILHIFRPMLPGQVRGLSVLAPVLTKLAEVDSIEDALLARLKVSALFAGFIIDADGTADMPGEQKESVLESGLEPGVLKVLRPGQSIEFPTMPNVGDGEAFLKAQLRAIAAGAGITYEQLTGDLSGVNYSSIRTGLLEHRRRVGALRRQTLEPRALDPLWRRWVELEILSGRLDAPDFEMAPEDYFDCEWVWPAWGQIDATKETDAEVSAIAAGLKSRREVIAQSGRDPDAVLEDIAREPPPPPPPGEATHHGAKRMKATARLHRNAPALTIRAAMLTPATVNEAERTVDVIAATGAGVQRRDARGPYLERLDIARVDPQRLVGAPVLNSHKRGDLADILGVVIAAWRDGDKLMARLKIESDQLWGRVKAGVVRNVSIGYEVAQFVESRDPQTGARVLTAAQWTPREVSFVPVPADAAAVTRGNTNMNRFEIDKDGFLVERDAAGRIVRRSAAAITFVREGDPPAEDTPAPEDAPEDNSPDVEALRTATDDALAAERDAVTPETREQRTARLDAIRTRAPTVRAAHTRTPSNDDPAVRAERMGEALYARVNPAHNLSEPARQFAHMSTVDLARLSLRQAGVSITGLSPDALITRALSTSDFPLALGNFTNRELRAGYEAAPSALRTAARQTTAKDFRAKQKIMVETSARLEKVNELGEFKHGGMVEAAESYKIDTFGKIITISRQTLINDDLGWTADLARGLGREAASFEARFLVDLLESGAGLGPDMSDGDPLFDDAHGNLGTGAAFGEAPLAAARLAMRKQKTLSGDVLGVGPKWLLIPPDLETSAEKLLTAIQATKTDDANPWAFLSLLVEPRFSSATRFYLAADPAQIEGLEYAYLAGAPGPQTETKTGFEVDGVSVKVRLDYGAGFVDWRGWHMNPGS